MQYTRKREKDLDLSSTHLDLSSTHFTFVKLAKLQFIFHFIKLVQYISNESMHTHKHNVKQKYSKKLGMKSDFNQTF